MKTKLTPNMARKAGFDDDQIQQVLALCEFLDCEPSDLTAKDYDHWGLAVYSLGQQEYAIGTDSEAQESAQKEIEDSAWAFTPCFLSDYCDLPEEVFTALQDKCEGSNGAVLSLINKSGGIADFAEQAISADGRGHFLSGYDGEENQQGEFYIYRIN